MLKKSTLQFIKDLEANNNRPWFEEHKADYLKAKENVGELVEAVKELLNQTDVIEFGRTYRIYRDVRFSKNKTPYKNFIGGYFRRMGAERRGSYIFRIDAQGLSVGGGFYGPNKEDLLRIRKELEMDGELFKAAITAPTFYNTYGEMLGEKVKTSPRGFDKTHPHIDVIRHKQFYFSKTFTKKESLSAKLPTMVAETYQNIRPFFDYMSNVLTTDLNGESLL